MSDNKRVLIERLSVLDLNRDEALLYMELLREPNTHLRLSQLTGINRTKVYRLVDQLIKRSLITRRTDDRGTFLVASDPTAFEIELFSQEDKVMQQRAAYESLQPLLHALKEEDSSTFVVHTYDGNEGLKQMQWHELQAKTDVLVLGNVTVEQIVGNRRWAEKFRTLAADLGCRTREIINAPYDNPQFTDVQEFMSLYESRSIAKHLLPLENPMIIYNDTVATYQFEHDKRVGVEIISKSFAATMRHVFEHYWNLATHD